MVTPDLAMHVVRSFLLPMFESDNRAAMSKTRSSVLGILEAATTKALKPLSAVSGTVYGELKLSDRLMTELTDSRETASRLNTQMNDALQRMDSAVKELATFRAKAQATAGDLELLRHQFDILKQQNDNSELAKALIMSQLSELRTRYMCSEEDRQRLTNELHEEKALNDKYRNKATELEHRNSLLRMENDVIGERLKGLYDAFDRLLGKTCFEEKIRQELKVIALSNASLSEFSMTNAASLQKASKDRDSLKDDFEETIKQRNEMKSERDKLFARLKKEVAKWELDYKRVDEERGKVQSDLVELEKRHKMVSEEQEKTRQKLKHMRSKRRQFGELEEKICKNCGKSYYDNENYNWSCRIHFSQYSGEMWWCCGKEGANAPGCRLSKHDCKEDEEDELQEKEEAKAKSGNARCTVSST